MNPLLDSIVTNGLLFDALGIIGLGVLALAALRLARKSSSWGGSMMGYGAVALLVARLYTLIAPHVMTMEVQEKIGAGGIALSVALPPLLLSFGLGGVVWGLWGHERWLRAGQP